MNKTFIFINNTVVILLYIYLFDYLVLSDYSNLLFRISLLILLISRFIFKFIIYNKEESLTSEQKNILFFEKFLTVKSHSFKRFLKNTIINSDTEGKKFIRWFSTLEELHKISAFLMYGSLILSVLGSNFPQFIKFIIALFIILKIIFSSILKVKYYNILQDLNKDIL